MYITNSWTCATLCSPLMVLLCYTADDLKLDECCISLCRYCDPPPDFFYEIWVFQLLSEALALSKLSVLPLSHHSSQRKLHCWWKEKCWFSSQPLELKPRKLNCSSQTCWEELWWLSGNDNSPPKAKASDSSWRLKFHKRNQMEGHNTWQNYKDWCNNIVIFNSTSSICCEVKQY